MKSPFSSSQKCKNKGCSIPKLSPLGAHIPIFLNYSYCSSHYKRLQRMATGSLFLGRKCELNSFKTAPFLLYFISSSKHRLKLASQISEGKCGNTVNAYNTFNICQMCVIHIVTDSQSMDTALPSFFFLFISFLGFFCLVQSKPSFLCSTHIILFFLLRGFNFVCHSGNIPEHLMTAQTQTGLYLQQLRRAKVLLRAPLHLCKVQRGARVNLKPAPT